MNKDTFSKIIKAATLVLITAMAVPVHSEIKQDSPANSENQQDYIVVFKDSFRGKIDSAKSLLISSSSKRSSPLSFKKEINDLIPAVVVPLTEAEAKRIASYEFVSFVEIDAVESPSSGWGLDRVNQRDLPLDNNFYRPDQGSGVHIYIVDTGIRPTHQEFTGRVGNVVSVVAGGGSDCIGHGTMVASIAAGATVGVAGDSTVHSIRVNPSCSTGTTASSNLVSGLNWVYTNGNPGSVVNFSYTSSAWAIHSAMEKLLLAGFVVVTSGGNLDMDACNDSSQIKARSSLRVAASTSNDARWSGSNYGSCLDLFAPGHNVYGATNSSNTSYTTDSGTSFSAPYVAGIAAIYLQQHPGSDPYEVMEAIVDGASINKVSNASGTPNLLSYTVLDQPDAYWQPTVYTQAPYEDPRLPKPGCTQGEVRFVYQSQNMAMRFDCM